MTEPRSARWEFESTRLAGEEALRQIERWLAGSGVPRRVAHDCQNGLGDAIANAIRHGNRDDPEKRVRILARLEPDRLVFRVADEGEGFDVEAISRYVRAVAEPGGPRRCGASTDAGAGSAGWACF